MTAGYCQPGSRTTGPSASRLLSFAVPCTGAAKFSRRQAAATACGLRTLVWMVTI